MHTKKRTFHSSYGADNDIESESHRRFAGMHFAAITMRNGQRFCAIEIENRMNINKKQQPFRGPCKKWGKLMQYGAMHPVNESECWNNARETSDSDCQGKNISIVYRKREMKTLSQDTNHRPTRCTNHTILQHCETQSLARKNLIKLAFFKLIFYDDDGFCPDYLLNHSRCTAGFIHKCHKNVHDLTYHFEWLSNRVRWKKQINLDDRTSIII